jgi:hypothetical protein
MHDCGDLYAPFMKTHDCYWNWSQLILYNSTWELYWLYQADFHAENVEDRACFFFVFSMALTPPPLPRYQVFIARLPLLFSFLQELIRSAHARNVVLELELGLLDWKKIMKRWELSLFTISSYFCVGRDDWHWIDSSLILDSKSCLAVSLHGINTRRVGIFWRTHFHFCCGCNLNHRHITTHEILELLMKVPRLRSLSRNPRR